MFNFLKNLFKPKNTEGPHPLDGPVRAATEKAKLPEPLPVTETVVQAEPPPVTPMFVPPVVTSVKETVTPVVRYQSEPAAPAANSTHWPFPTAKPEPAVEIVKEKKPRKPRAPKAVVMSAQPKKKK